MQPSSFRDLGNRTAKKRPSAPPSIGLTELLRLLLNTKHAAFHLVSIVTSSSPSGEPFRRDPLRCLKATECNEAHGVGGVRAGTLQHAGI
jgi:hypothetical protein